MKSIIRKQHSKRGQAAMEFLMTYGWAILAAIIAIGVLAYFGVFNPSRLAGSAGVLNAPLNVNAFNIESNSATAGCNAHDCINVEITHNAGNSIDISSASITITSGGTATCTDSSLPTSWQSGNKTTFNFDCGLATIFTSGDAVAGNIAIVYNTVGSTLAQTSTGNVRGVAQ